MTPNRATGGRGSGDPLRRFEIEVLPGLAPFARSEINACKAVTEIETEGRDLLRFRSDGWEVFHSLRRVVAVYRLLTFAIPRPRALLGDEHFRRLCDSVAEVRRRANEPFHGFRFGAAGRGSPVFARLARALEGATGLRSDPEGGDLLLRIRPGPDGGWQVLLRLTPRPLSARPWRVCNLPGGLNASVAAAMNDLLDLGRNDRYLNPMCGSGTLLIEAPTTAEAVGCDLDQQALACARENLQAADRASIELRRADATALPWSDHRFDAVACDLPWGDAVGSHRGNRELYPAFLGEMARVCTPDGRLVLLTHEIEIFARLLATQRAWRVRKRMRIYHGGHRPEMVLLTRSRSAPGGRGGEG